MWYNLARYILTNRLPLILILGLITVLMFVQAVQVEMDYELPKIIPSNNPIAKEYDKFLNQFGDDANVLIVGAQFNDLFEKNTLNKWLNLANEIEKIPSVKTVLSVPKAVILQKNSEKKRFELLPLLTKDIENQVVADSLRQIYQNQPFYKGKMWNEKTGATVMAVTIDSDVMNSKERIENLRIITKPIEAFGKKNKVKMHFSGLPYLRNFRVTTIARELKLFLLMAIGAMSIILLLLFRSLKGFILPVIVVLIGVIWTLGTTVLFGFKITLLIGLIPSLVVIIGIPNCVYLINKYHTEFKKHGDKKRALLSSIERIGNVTFYANLTTAIGFGVFATTNSKMLQEFGLVAGLNVLAVFVISLIIIPVCLSFLPEPRESMMKHLDNKIFNAIVAFLKRITSKHVYPIIIVALMVLGYSVYGLLQLQSKGFIFDDIPRKSESYEALKFLEKNFVGVVPFEVVIEMPRKGDVLKSYNLSKLDKLSKEVQKDPDIGIPISISEGMKLATQAYYGGKSSRYNLPNSMERNFILSYLGKMERNEENNILNAFTDKDRKLARLSFQMRDIGSNIYPKKIDSLILKSNKIFDPAKYKVTFTGTGVVSLESYNFLVKGLINSLLFAFILIAIIISFLFKSVRMLVIAFIPNIIPLTLTAGIMGYYNIYLKPSTVLIFSVAFGISVDFTIHFLAKYRLELSRHNWDVKKTVFFALQETGYSMMYTAIILLFGFAVFLNSTFDGTIYLGLLTCITLVASLLANLILLPAILLVIPPSREIQRMQAQQKAKEQMIYSEDKF